MDACTHGGRGHLLCKLELALKKWYKSLIIFRGITKIHAVEGRSAEQTADLQESVLTHVRRLRGRLRSEEGHSGGRQEGTQSALVRGRRQPQPHLEAALPRGARPLAELAGIQCSAAAARIPGAELEAFLGSADSSADIIQRKTIGRQSLHMPDACMTQVNVNIAPVPGSSTACPMH